LLWIIRKVDQVPDGLQREAKFTGMTDEAETFDRSLFIEPLIAL
jgi:hypothetical protein